MNMTGVFSLCSLPLKLPVIPVNPAILRYKRIWKVISYVAIARLIKLRNHGIAIVCNNVT